MVIRADSVRHDASEVKLRILATTQTEQCCFGDERSDPDFAVEGVYPQTRLLRGKALGK